METVPYHFQFAMLCPKQFRLWLVRPMREWQSLPHEAQIWVDVAESVAVFSFRLVLFSMTSLVFFTSPSFSRLWRRQRYICCGLLQCLPSSWGRFPSLSCLVCTRPCTSAVGGHGVVCQRQVLHKGCP